MTDTFSAGKALLIGVGGHDIPNTIDDASGISDILKDPERAAYHPENVNLLVGEATTRKGILDALDNLVKKSEPDSTILLYYSGHGDILKDDGTFFIRPHNYNSENIKDTWVTAEEIRERIDVINSKKFILLLDCCHAGSITKGADDDKPQRFNQSSGLSKKLDSGAGSVIFSSCRDNEYSLIYPRSKYSLFTECLIEALDGKFQTAKSGDYVRMLDVITYVMEEVKNRSKKQQHPYINSIKNMDNNFAVSYLPEVIRKGGGGPAPMPPKPPDLLKLEYDGLVRNSVLLMKKIEFFGNQQLLAVDPNMIFSIDQQMAQLMAKKLEFDEKIERIKGMLGI